MVWFENLIGKVQNRENETVLDQWLQFSDQFMFRWGEERRPGPPRLGGASGPDGGDGGNGQLT